MRIATYNVLGLTGFPAAAARTELGTPEQKVAHFVQVFNALAADVLALQEGPSLEVARRIAAELGCHLAAFPSPGHWPGYLLSRHPLRESRVFSHAGPAGPQGPFSRCFGAALVDVAGADLWVVNVHLHPNQKPLRAREAEGLAAKLTALDLARCPAAVLGDFNSPPGEPAHTALAALGFVNAMERVGGGVQATMDTAGTGQLAIDHVYLSPPLAATLRAARVVRDTGFRMDAPAPAGAWVHSDHLPVVTDLLWPSGADARPDAEPR